MGSPSLNPFKILGLLAGVFLGLLFPQASKAMPVPTPSPYRTQLYRWQAAAAPGFQDWASQGIRITSRGQLQLDPQRPLDPLSLAGGSLASSTALWGGEATSPPLITRFPFAEAILSWNATTPPGTWLEVFLRAKVHNRWTNWYHGGVWAGDPQTLASHSLPGQMDADGRMATDVLVLQQEAEALQVRVRLWSRDPAHLPTVNQMAVALSNRPVLPHPLPPGDPSTWGQVLPVPPCSQMVYPDGGRRWCSPTSLAMVLAYWQQDGDPCEPKVRSAVAGVYDATYRGYGNWVFNVAYAAEQGFAGVVARFQSFAQVEPWIAAGVPVILSFAWAEGELQGAPLPKSPGHLAVLVGFDANGDPVVHDPAAPTDAQVQRTYPRAQLEALWLKHSGGTVYLIYPPYWSTPPL